MCVYGDDWQQLRRSVVGGGIAQTKEMTDESYCRDLMLPVRKHSGFKQDIRFSSMKTQRSGRNIVAEAVPHTSLRGILVSSSEWDLSDPDVGDYRFSAYEPVKQLIHKSPDLYSTNGIVHFDGKYYIVVYFEILGMPYISSYLIDDTTYETISTRSNVPVGCRAVSMVHDPADGNIYGCFLNDSGNGHVFGIMDLNSGRRNKIADMNCYLYAMSIDKKGRLLGIDPRTGLLYEVDRKTGAMTVIGNTGLKSVYATSGAIDPKSGRYYFATCNDSGSALYEINTETAAATKIYDFRNFEEIMGMWIPMPPHADASPAAAKSLTLDFAGISRTGKVSFTAPVTNFDESPGTGSITYRLTCNDSVLSEGNVGWGADFSQEYTVPHNGVYTFSVDFANAAGRGPARSVSKYIGQIRPSATDSVAVKQRGNCFDISWSPVTTSKFGGEFHPEEVFYNVVRVHDGKKVATMTKQTNATDTFPEPAGQMMLSYAVVPVYREEPGDTTVSASMLYGYLSPPFKETFSKSRMDFVAGWVCLDGDGDNAAAWKHDYSAGRMRVKSAMKSDILATPCIYLEPDKIYTLRYGISSYSSSTTAAVSACLADTLSIEAFSKNVLINPEPISTSSKTKYQYYTAEISVAKPGMYHIGFRSGEGTGLYTYLDNVEIKAPAASSAPAAPSGLKVVPDGTGRLSAKVSIKAPALTLGGDSLASMTRLVVVRGSEVVKTFMSPAPEEQLSFTDTVSSPDRYAYTAYAYNNAGKGGQVSAAAFIGINIPAGVGTDISIAETSVLGTVKVSWSHVRMDKDGNPLNTDKVKYHIVAPDRSGYLAKDLTDTTAVVKIIEPSQRSFVRVFLQSATEAGESDTIVASNMIAAGMPYKMPVAESFADQKNTLIWGIRTMNPLSDAMWIMEKDNMTVKSQDGDKGYVMFNSTYADQEAILSSGKINISGDNPVLSFYYYALPESRNELEVLVGKDMTFSSVRKIIVSETGQTGWVRVLVPLTGYKGETIQFAFLGRARNLTQIHVDNITVGNIALHDLSTGIFSIPGRIYTNRGNDITVEVVNSGAEKASGYKVVLYAGEKEVDSADGKELAPAASDIVRFSHTPAVGYAPKTKYKVEVIYDADMNKGDNTTSEVEVAVITPSYPYVEGLTGKAGTEGVTLNWNVTDGNGPARIVEDAEELTPFSIGLKNSELKNDNVGEWTMKDCDGSVTYVFSNGSGGIVNFPNASVPKAFMVYPYKEALIDNSNLMGYDGSNNWFACFASVQQANDDWMISPRLSGRRQTVRFMARSLQDEYPEAFEVLYSTGSENPSDFIRVMEVKAAPAAWKEYAADLPEGASRFAIRCVSKDKFLFMTDNIEYEAYNPFPDIKLLGYNVYRDGRLITSKPVAAASYLDAAASASGSYTYHVSAVYDKGESRLSGPVTVAVSATGDIVPADLSVVAGKGFIRICGAEGGMIRVLTSGGLTVALQEGKIVNEIKLNPGIYMVDVDGKMTKVMVK